VPPPSVDGLACGMVTFFPLRKGSLMFRLADVLISKLLPPRTFLCPFLLCSHNEGSLFPSTAFHSEGSYAIGIIHRILGYLQRPAREPHPRPPQAPRHGAPARAARTHGAFEGPCPPPHAQTHTAPKGLCAQPSPA